jgi:hypothetical protein
MMSNADDKDTEMIDAASIVCWGARRYIGNLSSPYLQWR